MSSASDMIRGQFHKTIYDIFSSQKDRTMFLNQNLRFIKIKKFTKFSLFGVNFIGVGRFRILGGGGGGQDLEYWGGGARGGPNSQQAHDVVMMSMRRNDVASTSFRRHVPTRFLINECQIITFLIKI